MFRQRERNGHCRITGSGALSEPCRTSYFLSTSNGDTVPCGASLARSVAGTSAAVGRNNAGKSVPRCSGNAGVSVCGAGAGLSSPAGRSSGARDPDRSRKWDRRVAGQMIIAAALLLDLFGRQRKTVRHLRCAVTQAQRCHSGCNVDRQNGTVNGQQDESWSVWLIASG